MAKRLLCIASILFALVMLGSCDDNKSDGAGGGSQPSAVQNDPAVRGTIAIEGLATVSSRGTVTYQAVLNLDGGVVANRKWEIQGHAAIVGSTDGRTVEVDITGPEGGGEFTLSLAVKIAKGPWFKAPDFKVTVSPYPQFRVEVHNPILHSLTPTSQTGTGTITATSEFVEYQYWSLHFVGNTTTFPGMINVRVQALNGCGSCSSNWANGAGGGIYLDFPKQEGGSVGVSGTVYDPGANRPDLRTPGGQTNRVWFAADGVQPMTLTINR